MTGLVHYSDIERELIGQLMASAEAYDQVSELIVEGDFYEPKCARAFKAIGEITKAEGRADLSAVFVWTTRNPDTTCNPTAPELAEWSARVIGIGTVMQNAAVVKEASRRRQLWALGQRLTSVGVNPMTDLEEAEKDIAQVLEQGIATVDSIDMRQANVQLKEKIESNKAKSLDEIGMSTGLTGLNKIGGLYGGDLVVIGAETSQGKSTLAMNMAVAAAGKGHPVFVWSMEMTGMQLASRINAPFAGVPSQSMLRGKLTDEQVRKVDAAIELTDNLPIYFDERSTTTIDGIIAGSRAAIKRKGVEMIVVDYLQILSTNAKAENNELFMGEVSRRLKNLAKRYKVCVVALSQMNRDRNNPQPSLARLRASGQIGEAADQVILIYRPEAVGRKSYNGHSEPVEGTAQIIVAKNRNGDDTCDIIVDFDRATSRFSDYDPARHTATPGGTPAPYPDPGAQPAAWNGSQAAPF